MDLFGEVSVKVMSGSWERGLLVAAVSRGLQRSAAGSLEVG